MVFEQSALIVADALLRIGGMTLLLLLAGLLVIGQRDTWVGRLGALMGVGAAAYLVCPFIEEVTFITAPVVVLCVVNPALLWLAGRALFEDNFAPGAVEWAMPGLLFGLFVARLVFTELGLQDITAVSQSMHGLIQISLALHLLWRVWHDHQNDLVEARRSFRRLFVGFGGLLLAVIAVVEFSVLRPDSIPALLLLQAAAVFGLSLWLSISVLQINGLYAPATPVRPAPDDGAPDDPDASRLVALVRDDQLFLQEGLTVGVLAETAGLPEYRARRIINGQLGHRNFSDFLNGYRIEEAARRLENPDMRRLPILTIALDVGFGSIGPFNRAFKDRLGMTPSEYRREAFSKS